uniref:EF-hand domain-containing protein n=1 Tax=Knipowitschia caucasica TaxID=637954 RepID=A0AAV2MCK9_KNICA
MSSLQDNSRIPTQIAGVWCVSREVVDEDRAQKGRAGGCISPHAISAAQTQDTAPPPPRMSLPNLENASTLESAMQLMIQTFHKYSGNEGDKYTLSRAELKEMLTVELGNYLGNAQDKEAVDKVMGDLDSNNDGEVDFTEFIILVGALTVACNDFFLEYNDKDQKKK